LGQHNCSVGFDETCVCFGSSTPRCVDVNSQEYLGRIQQSRQIITSTVGNAQLFNNATLKSSICQLASLGFDLDYASTLPSVMSGSYLRNKTSCSFANLVPSFDDSVCTSQYAKYLCCSLCSGLLDAELSQFPNLNRNDKIFYGLYFGPIYTLTCGSNPNIIVNKDTCNGPNVLSYNDIVNQLQCGSSFQPSYGLLAFNISVYNPSSFTEQHLEILILAYIKSLGQPQPSVVSVNVGSDNPYLYLVQIGYSGNSNNQTVTSVSNSLNGSNFTNYLANSYPRASISAITTDNIIGIFPQPSSEPFPSTQPQPSSPSPQPLPNNLSPQPANQTSEPLPSTEPLPDNLSPEPNPLIPVTPQPISAPSNPISPISTPTQPLPSPTGAGAPSVAAKSVVVSMIILIASMVIGLSI